MSFRRLLVLMRREARATLRDPFTITILIGVPMLALVLFGSILSTEIKSLPLGVLDASNTAASRRIVAELAAQNAFTEHPMRSRAAIERALRSGVINAAIVIPPDFDVALERQRAGGPPPEIRVLYDGGEAVLAENSEGFMKSLVAATSAGLVDRGATPDGPPDSAASAARGAPPTGVRVVSRALFNPTLDGRPYMVAGTFGFVLSFTTTLIIAVSIVNERFSGTFEQLQVTPATSLEILLGKI